MTFTVSPVHGSAFTLNSVIAGGVVQEEESWLKGLSVKWREMIVGWKKKFDVRSGWLGICGCGAI